MSEDEYAAALAQIADDHIALEKVRRIAEGLSYNPPGSELHAIGVELIEIVGAPA